MTHSEQKKEKGEIEKKSFGMIKINREMIEIGEINLPSISGNVRSLYGPKLKIKGRSHRCKGKDDEKIF